MKHWTERLYHPYWRWEEVKHNMWGVAENRIDMLAWAIEFTGDHKKYGSWMMKVIQDWTYSCEHNLSNPTQNRQAWIGQAACAYANQCPEDIVRKAWGHLTQEQQRAANNEADMAIEEWQNRRIERCQNEA